MEKNKGKNEGTQEMGKCVDLTTLTVESVDGTFKEVDMSKDFANLLYEAAENVEVAIAAQDLFKTGKICISEAIRGFCIQRANKLFYPYRKAVLKAIEA